MMDRYASHLPVVKAVLRSLPIKSVIEFGMGIYSTRIFCWCNFVENITSVESNPEWYTKISKLHESREGFCSIYHPTSFPCHSYAEDAEEAGRCSTFYSETLRKRIFDLAFIDNFIPMRKLALQCALNCVPYIIIHDSEQAKWYEPYLENLPQEYMRFRFQCQAPSTDLIVRRTTDRDLLLSALHQHGFKYAQKNIVQYNVKEMP